MAIMIPEIPHSIPKYSREDEMFNCLQELPDSYYVCHSFHIHQVDNKTLHEGEIDFIIFHPDKGMLLIEAKAGKVKLVNNTWYYGNDRPMKGGGPYRQAATNRYKLQELFDNKRLSELWMRCKVLPVVWFPSVNRTYLRSLSLPANANVQLTLTADDFENIESAVENIFKIDVYRMDATQLSGPEVKSILLNVICPALDLIPSMASELRHRRNVFNRLIREQAVILNFLDEQKSAAISGVAGSGKTMLAVEKARRHADQGESVLFLCFNSFLAAHLRKVNAHENITFSTIHSMAYNYAGLGDMDFQSLKEVLINQYTEDQFPYKHVVIDEGQDFGQHEIYESGVIQTLSEIVLSDDIDGTFYVFYDKYQLVQSKIMPQYITDADCRLTLSKNCRNTVNIAVTSTRPLASGLKPVTIEGSIQGEMTQIRFVDDANDVHDAVVRAIQNLYKKGLEHIVILTCETEERSVLCPYVQDRGFVFRNQQILFTTARKFKGLEADAIVLVDINYTTFADEEKQRLLYVAASRACFNLELISQMSQEDCAAVLDLYGKPSMANSRKSLATHLNALMSLGNK